EAPAGPHPCGMEYRPDAIRFGSRRIPVTELPVPLFSEKSAHLLFPVSERTAPAACSADAGAVGPVGYAYCIRLRIPHAQRVYRSFQTAIRADAGAFPPGTGSTAKPAGNRPARAGCARGYFRIAFLFAGNPTCRAAEP